MKFPNLPAASALSGTEIIPLTQGGIDKRSTAQAIANTADPAEIAFSNSGFSASNVADAIVEASTGGSKFIQIALSDMTTDLTTGTAIGAWFAPENGNLADVWIGVHDPSSSGDVRIDMNDSVGTVFTTRPLIQATEATSLTGTAAVLDGTVSFLKGDKFTFDIDDAGTDAKGLQVVVEYSPT